MSQNLVSIASIDQKSSSPSSGGSSTGKTAGIAVGVVVGVLIIASAIGAFFFRNRKNKQNAQGRAADDANPKENLIRQGYYKGELPTDAENPRFEMDVPNQQKPPDRPLPGWVNEKANSPGFPSDVAEVDGGADFRSELGSQQREFPFSRPLHEMHDPSTPPVELPGNHPEAPELHGSNPASAASSPRIFGRMFRGSNPGSPVSHSSSTKRLSFRERLSGRPAASRSSTVDSLPSLESSAVGAAPGPSTPAPAHALAPVPREEPPVGSGHSGEPFSPVSRQGTFSPDPVPRQGTFTPDHHATNPLFSPVSPSSPEAGRGGMLERLGGSFKQSQ